MLEFISDPDLREPFFVLRGFAGTGKTFLLREVLARCKHSAARFMFTTPTNKACKVLRAVTGNAITIYSLLGLRIEANGEVKGLINGEPKQDLSEIDVVFLDEASMVNSYLMALLRQESRLHRFKIIFIGDAGQLPPVGELDSPVWGIGNEAVLNKVMRHDGSILNLVTKIREVMYDYSPKIVIKNDHSENEGVWKFTKKEFNEAVWKAAHSGEFAEGEKTKVIAWRNVRVAEYNHLIRNAIFGAAALPGYYLPGDRVIATAPCKIGEETILHTDDEAIVEGVIATTHPTVRKYKALELKGRSESNHLIRLLVLHPESQREFDNDCALLAHEAKGNGKLWRKFWELKELFHQVKYGYSITAHRSQGSTYETVYVDYIDILYNRNRKEAFQALYVACSRPTTRLVMA